MAAICGRFGGDEFVVLGVGSGFYEAFQTRFSYKLANLNKDAGKPYEIEASLGYVTVTPTQMDSLQNLIQIADARMYENKKKAARD